MGLHQLLEGNIVWKYRWHFAWLPGMCPSPTLCLTSVCELGYLWKPMKLQYLLRMLVISKYHEPIYTPRRHGLDFHPQGNYETMGSQSFCTRRCVKLGLQSLSSIGLWSDPKYEFSGTESPDPDPRESQICLRGSEYITLGYRKYCMW